VVQRMGSGLRSVLLFRRMKKKCGSCGKSDGVEFAKNPDKRDGLSSTCKKCQSGYAKAHYRANKAYYLRKAKLRKLEWLRILTLVIHKAKDQPCVDCGNKYPPCAMDLDHVRGTKLANVASLRSHAVSMARVLSEIAKCSVRCAVCHRIKTHACEGRCGEDLSPMTSSKT